MTCYKTEHYLFANILRSVLVVIIAELDLRKTLSSLSLDTSCEGNNNQKEYNNEKKVLNKIRFKVNIEKNIKIRITITFQIQKKRSIR
jgi:uncharacterized membrane protein YhiD involved in acid resistance